MKNYKIKVTFTDGAYKYIFATAKHIQAKGNVIQYCRSKFPQCVIKEIKTRSWHRDHHYWELNYDPFFEYAKQNHIRVEAHNYPGYEDYTGYGGRTNGKINRFYIGRSTGFIPIYLEILTNRSTGGSALFVPAKKYARSFGYVNR
jgi:hypothetical protein